MPADHEIWVIGDKYMTFVAQHLDYWKEKARKNPHETIHILRWYDVKAFAPYSISTNAVEVILNSLIGGLNNRPKLPHTIVVMLGDTNFWCEPQALRFTMDSIIHCLLKEIKRIVQARQEDLPLKAVGVDPAIFFVKLNWKPDKAVDSVIGYPKKRRTFNKLLDSIVRPRGGNTITLHEINERYDETLFLAHGELSEKGYRQVWNSLSEALEDFEHIGKQKRKDFSLLDTQFNKTIEVDSSMISSDDEFITDATSLATPKMQNKRRFDRKPQAASRGRIKKKNIYGQSFFQQKF